MKKENSIAKSTDVVQLSLVDQEVFKYGQKNYDRRHTKTEPEKISYRKGKGGKEFKYIKKEDCREWLDLTYPVWSFEVDTASTREYGGFVYTKGTLKVYVTELGVFRAVEAYGCDEIEFKEDKPISIMYIKNAETDALKRCCVALGAFNDVYSEIETDTRLVSDEDMQWYVETILPVAMKSIKTARSLFVQMRMFSNGSLSKEELYKHYFGG